ncbi:peptidylprolyl isomerase [Marinomonas epiphytica]
MKFLTLLSAIFLLCAPFQSASAQPKKLDGIVAIVDSQALLESDINARFQIIKERVPGGQMTPNIRRQIVNQMIDEILQANYARKIGMRPSSREVDNAILGVAQNFQTDLAGLKNILQQQGISFIRYRDQIEQEILINTIKNEIVKRRISITEQEIEDYLNSSTSLSKEKEQVHLRHLIIRGSDPAKAQQEISDIASKINSEADFIEQALAHSQGQFAIQGGDLGWRPLSQLPPLFVRALGTAQTSLVGPLQSNAGFHLLWVIEKRNPDTTLQKQTKTRHLLVRPNEIRSDKQTQALANDLYQQLQSGADFATLAKENSEDQGSTLQGGDLGWVTPGTMVPEFEEMMNSTSVGKYSRPFKTQFGWHILEVEGRRDTDVSEQVKRSNAEQALTAQKRDIVLSNWLEELRADAFIDRKES